MKKILFCTLCIIIRIALFACSNSQTQFSQQEKENIIKCVDAKMEYNATNYNYDDEFGAIYITYLNLDYSKKEELFDLANSQKLKDYIGKDTIEIVDNEVQANLDMLYDYLPEEEITNLAKEADISNEEYIDTVFKDAVYSLAYFENGGMLWQQDKEYTDLLTLYKDYIEFLKTL